MNPINHGQSQNIPREFTMTSSVKGRRALQIPGANSGTGEVAVRSLRALAPGEDAPTRIHKSFLGIFGPRMVRTNIQIKEGDNPPRMVRVSIKISDLVRALGLGSHEKKEVMERLKSGGLERLYDASPVTPIDNPNHYYGLTTEKYQQIVDFARAQARAFQANPPRSQQVLRLDKSDYHVVPEDPSSPNLPYTLLYEPTERAFYINIKGGKGDMTSSELGLGATGRATIALRVNLDGTLPARYVARSSAASAVHASEIPANTIVRRLVRQGQQGLVGGTFTEEYDGLVRSRNRPKNLGPIEKERIPLIIENDRRLVAKRTLLLPLMNGGEMAERKAEILQLPPAEKVRIDLEYAVGLRALHQNNIVHRDQKLQNTFMSRDNQGRLHPHIADYGMAMILERGRPSTGAIMGSPGYYPPSHMTNYLNGKKTVDVRTADDIYQFGCVLSETCSSFFDVSWVTQQQTPLEAYRNPMGNFIERRNAGQTLVNLNTDTMMRREMLEDCFPTNRAGHAGPFNPRTMEDCLGAVLGAATPSSQANAVETYRQTLAVYCLRCQPEDRPTAEQVVEHLAALHNVLSPNEPL